MRKATIAVMALIAAMTTTGAEAKWLRADTDNFIIYSESSERSLRSFAEKLQRFDATLRVRLRIPGGKEPNRLTIYLVPRAADAGRLATGESGSSIAGFYSADLDGSFAVSHREVIEFKGTSAAQQTLFHEYTHHFMKRYFAAAFPAWFIEGFAEFYSTADFTGKGQYQVGRPAYFRAHGLINMPRIPVADLLLKKPREMRSSGQMDVYYGRAWLLTHMLYYHPDRAGQLTAYIDAINRGEDGEKAAVAAFGDLVALDRDLQRYLGRPLTFMTSAEPIPVPGTVTVTVLPNAEDALLQWRLERRSARGGERLAEVRDELRKLTAEYGDSAGIWYELARAEWDLGDEKRDAAAARAAVDKALAIEPKHVRANILLGEMMIHDLGHRDTVSNADWVAARQPIILATTPIPTTLSRSTPIMTAFYGRASRRRRLRSPGWSAHLRSVPKAPTRASPMRLPSRTTGTSIARPGWRRSLRSTRTTTDRARGFWHRSNQCAKGVAAPEKAPPPRSHPPTPINNRVRRRPEPVPPARPATPSRRPRAGVRG